MTRPSGTDFPAPLERCIALALEGVQRPYPYHLTHVWTERLKIADPDEIHPVFNGCFDWHSAVHGHWLLARGVRLLPGSEIGARCRKVLEEQLQERSLRAEAEHVRAHPGFERPYGLAWVLELACELEGIDDEMGRSWRTWIRPLELASVENLTSWLPKLSHPMRTGTHNQTAFAMCLLHDWAARSGDAEVLDLVIERAGTFFGADHGYPLHLEPGGEDFLSPSLGAAWLMTRVLQGEAFAAWLDRAMPDLGRGFHFQQCTPSDRSDGRLAHLDGLNLSVGWMLHAIARALPADDARGPSIEAMAESILATGMASIATTDYAGTHWLGTFAAYAIGPGRKA